MTQAAASPSSLGKRWPVAVLALGACAVATYLTLYQLHVIEHVWEPFFGDGSRRILRESSLAHFLPIPDASLGALLYLAEAILEMAGGPMRWRTAPWLVLLVGLVSTGLGVAGLALVICQPTLYGAFCTLCLVSAACSLTLFAATLHEVLASWHHVSAERRRGASFWHAVLGQQLAANV